MRQSKILFVLSLYVCFFLCACAPANRIDTPSTNITRKADEKVEGIQAELVAQLPHVGVIMAVDYAKNHEFFVTGAKDSTVKVWRPDGQLIRTIDVGMWVFGMKLFQDDKYVMIYNNLGQMKIASIETGRIIDLPKVKQGISSVAVSKQGNLYAVAHNLEEVFVNTMNGKNIATLKMPPIMPTKRKTYGGKVPANNLVFSSNGRLIIASNMYGEIIIWSLDGKLIKHAKISEGTITSLDMHDNKLLVTFGWPYKQFKDFSKVKTKSAIFNLAKEKNGATIFETPLIDMAIFSENGKKIYALTRGKKKNRNVTTFDLNGKLLKSFKVSSSSHGARRIAANSDGTRIVTIDNRLHPTRINMWSPDGTRLLRIQKPFDAINEIALNKSDMVIASATSNNQVKLWSVQGKYLGALRVGSAAATVDFSNDGKQLFIGTLKNIQVWDIKRRKRLQTLKAQKFGINDIALAPDNTWFVAVGGTGRAQLFIKRNNKYIQTKNIEIGKGHHYTVEITHDNNNFIVGLNREGLKFFNKNGKLLWEKSPKRYKDENGKHIVSSRFCAIDHSDSGDQFAALNAHSIVIFNNKGKQLSKIPIGSRHDNVGAIKYINNDKQLLFTTQQKIALWDLKEKKVLSVYKCSSNTVSSVIHVPDTTLMISSSRDSMIRLWNLKSGYGANVALEKGEWIIYDHNGFFDASLNGGKIINFSKGYDTFTADQFALYFNRPDIIYALLGLATKEHLAHLNQQYKKRIHKAFINEKYLSPSINIPKVKLIGKKRNKDKLTLTISMEDIRANLKSYQIYNNNVPLFGRHGKKVSGHSVKAQETINLVSGKNIIEVSVFNENGSESYRISTTETLKQRKKSNLYFVGLGVSKYKKKDLNLRYAAKDVTDLSNAISKKYKSYNTVYTKHFLDSQVKKTTLIDIKQFLSKATVHDTVVLFISGHGAYERNQLAEYYYLTHNSVSDNLKETSISWTSIENLLYQVKANKKLMFMDTCESGEMDIPNQIRAFKIAKENGFYARANQLLGDIKNHKRERRQFLYFKDRYIYNDLVKGSGTYVFSSSSGGEMSFESEKLKNGFFTNAILEALGSKSKKADKNKNDVISIDELVEYVSFTVSNQTGGLQNPTVDRGNPKQDFFFKL